MNKPISFIYFDLGGVVIDNEQAIWRIAEEFRLDVEKIREFFDTHWKEACIGTLDTAAYLTRFKEAFRFDHPAENFVDFFTEYQGQYQETHDLIHELARDYRLGILSNAESGMVNALIGKGKIPNIRWDVMIESAQIGLVKPQKKIYHLARKKANVLPEEILFIDDRQVNIDAAVALGWRAVLFDFFDVPASVRRVREFLRGTS